MQNLWSYFPVKMGESRNMIAGLYDLEETIGEGHYAVVKLARFNNMIWIWTQSHVLCPRHVFTGEKVAVKVIDKLKLDQATRMQMLQVKPPDLNEEFAVATGMACHKLEEFDIPHDMPFA